MVRKLFLAAAFVGFLLILPNISKATTVQRLSLEELTKRAHSIVMGKVRRSRTAWSSNGKLILTTYTVDVQESFKGQPGSAIELTTIGGKIGDLTLYVAGMPALRDGESAILFVEQTGAYSTVMGLAQGKFTVANGQVSNSVSDLNFADGGGPRPIRMSLDAFRQQIRAIVGRQP
jgi:hypothetical protein